MSQQYVIFRLNGESFGVEIAHVLEIIRTQATFKVPNSPEFIDGLINLRGKVYTLYNLRKKFNFPTSDIDTEDSKILIVNINSMYIGLTVDSVDEIIQIEEDAVEATPATFNLLEQKYLSGVAKIGEKLILLLDLESLTLSVKEYSPQTV